MKPSWTTVLRECLAQARPLGTERVSRAEARGRILTEEVSADRDYPAGDLSMMDGYAVGPRRSESYVVDAENLPGMGPGEALAENGARRIFTGAELPPGAAQVIPQELVQRQAGQISVQKWPDALFVRPRGGEARRDETVLKKGACLGAVELAILAALGRGEVEVVRLPRISHLITGDEIVPADDPLAKGKLRDANSDLVASLLADFGFSVARHGRVSDDRGLFFQTVSAMAEAGDFLLISGGASVGAHDHARPALESAGFEFLAQGLHLRPGRPVGVARRGQQWAAALPGNPLSHLATMRLLILPLLQVCAGKEPELPRMIRGFLDAPLARETPSRDTFWPAAGRLHDGCFHLLPGRFLSSGDLIGVAGMNALISLPAGKPVPHQGGTVYFLSLSPFFA